MNKLILSLILTLFGFFQLSAFEYIGAPLGEPRKIAINDFYKNWTICLDDESCWEVIDLEKNRERTWTEWWYEISPTERTLDDSFFSNPRQWKPGNEVQVYQALGDFLPDYRYLLVDMASGKKVFAKYIPFGTKPIPNMEFAAPFFHFPIVEEVKILSNQHWIGNALILSDNTIWLLSIVQKREKFWHNINTVQPDCSFFFKVDSWKSGDDLEIYSYEGSHLENHKIYNPELKNKPMYLIRNKSTNQLGYAQPCSLVEFANSCNDYAEKRWKEGYDRGYIDGYDDGYDDGED